MICNPNLAGSVSASKVLRPKARVLVRFLCTESLRHLTDKNIFTSSAFLNENQQCYAVVCSVPRLFIYPGVYIVYVVKGTLCDIGYFAKSWLTNRVFWPCFSGPAAWFFVFAPYFAFYCVFALPDMYLYMSPAIISYSAFCGLGSIIVWLKSAVTEVDNSSDRGRTGENSRKTGK